MDAKFIFEKEILVRWPDWKPTQKQQFDWLYFLQRYRADDIHDAVLEYIKNHEMLTQPKMNVLLKIADRIAAARPRENKYNRPRLLYFIECTHHEDENKIGQKIDFYAPTDKNIDTAKLCKEAEENRISCGNLYGGQWRVINRRQDVPQDEVEREIIPASKNQKRQILKDFIDNNPRYKNLFKKSIFFAEITKDIDSPQELVPSAAIDDEPWEFG